MGLGDGCHPTAAVTKHLASKTQVVSQLGPSPQHPVDLWVACESHGSVVQHASEVLHVGPSPRNEVPGGWPLVALLCGSWSQGASNGCPWRPDLLRRRWPSVAAGDLQRVGGTGWACSGTQLGARGLVGRVAAVADAAGLATPSGCH